MAGYSPSPDFLAQLNAQLGALGNPAAVAPPPPPPPPVPAHPGGPSISWLGPASRSMGAPVQAPPADPFGLMQPQPAAPPAQAAPPPAEAPPGPVDRQLMPPTSIDPANIPGPAPAAPPAAPVPDVQFAQAGGGFSPAHEAAIRGPEQNAHLMASFQDPLQAADRMEGRSRWQAEEERNMYEVQAARAMEQQAAAEKVALQRQAQMERLSMDYEDQVQRLGQMHLDSNRWWSTKSTGDKIATGVIAFLGGLGALDPRGNGRNLAYEAIMRDADADVEAQKFDYMVQQGQVQGAHNAFAVAMDRYRNEDAAHAAARAAALDFTLAKVGEMQAQWKGVESANAADDLRARLLSERERTIAAGIRFVPAQASPGRYQMMVRGQMAPGTFSEKDAQQVFMEHLVKPAEKYDEQTLGIRGQMAVKAMEGAGKDGSVEGAKDIAHQMQTAGIPKMRALTQAALAAMADDEGGKGEAATRALVGTLVPFVGESAANGIMSDKANAREQALQAFANLNMNQLSGGAISPSEEGRLKKQLGSASDPAARRRALTSVMTQLDAAEKNIKAPYVGTGAAERYDRGAGAKPTGTAKTLKFHGDK